MRSWQLRPTVTQMGQVIAGTLISLLLHWTGQPPVAGAEQTALGAGNPKTFDPTLQAAPPGLEVGTGNTPITSLEVISMRQELGSLLGRFESALLTASALSDPTHAKASQIGSGRHGPLITASLQDINPLSSFENWHAANTAVLQPGQAAAQVRQTLNQFPKLVAQQNYAEARQQWLQARQVLWDHYPVDRLRSSSEIRAIWLDRGTIVRARSVRDLTRLFDRLAEAGINTVFFETVNAGYPIYPSKVAPAQNPLTRWWDPLDVAVQLAHERDMELHAWLWTFAVGNRRHNELLNLPSNYVGPVLSAHPDWASYDDRGRMMQQNSGKFFLDPANPQARYYLLQLVDEIITRYPVDGIQLDYIRYPFQDPSAARTYGYGKAARQQFQRLTGIDPVQLSPRESPRDSMAERLRQRELWQRWTEFRSNQITGFVAEVSKRLRQKRPEVILSVAVFPMSEHERIHKLQQHWEVWGREGYVDLIVPMAYALDTNRFQRLTKPILTTTELGDALVLPGMRLLDVSEVVAVDKIQLLRDLPANGYSLFAATHLNERLHSILNNTQGAHPSARPQPIPHRQPFDAALARLTTLQQEWALQVARNRLWLEEPSDWQDQNEALRQNLQQLASQPSPEQLEQAQERLNHFQERFNTWMQWYSWKNPYQVEAWQYRLAALGTLLDYGDRLTLHRRVQHPLLGGQPAKSRLEDVGKVP